jgi:DDE superfamily endonuclease
MYSHIRSVNGKKKFENDNVVTDNVADTATKTCTATTRRRGEGGGRKCSLSGELIVDLKGVFDALRDEDYGVSLRIMVTELRRLSPASVIGCSESAINSRVYRLLRKWDNTWRRGTHKAQNTRHSSEVIGDFLEYFRLKFRLLRVDCSRVYNVDETNVFFSQEPVFTYAKRGSRTVSIKGTDSSQRCTVMLGGNLAGGKLLPFIIFKGANTRTGHILKEIEKGEGYPEDIRYGVQAKAWMDETLMLEWVEKVWKPEVEGKGVTYLILDECRTHLTIAVRNAFTKCRTEVELIPGGYTSKLQPMDVGINKPFKNFIRAEFHDWLVVNRNRKTRPSRQEVSWWVREAWNNVSDSVVRNSFRGAGLVVACSAAVDDELEEISDDTEACSVASLLDPVNVIM